MGVSKDKIKAVLLVFLVIILLAFDRYVLPNILKSNRNNMEEEDVKMTQEIIDRINCPYQVFKKGNTAKEVNAAYREALQRGKKEGFVPVLVVSDGTLAEWLEILDDEEAYSKEEVIKQTKKAAKKILDERFLEYTEDYVDDTKGETQTDEGDWELSELMGDFVVEETLNELSSFMEYDGSGIMETILFEIPVENPWEVIAWVPMGGWNECPEAAEMMEVCKYWYEKYGAIPAVISHDTLEFVVEKPVADKEQAWELAKEQYAFCPDRVDQGTANCTIGELAGCLSQSEVWFFWWD